MRASRYTLVMRRALLVILLAILSAPLAAAIAYGHAQFERAMPAAGSTVAAAPKEVTIWFSQKLEPKFSTIEVRDVKGAAMQTGPVHAVAGNSAQLSVPLKTLPPGTYKVIWRVLSVDTHRLRGEFTFKVGP